MVNLSAFTKLYLLNFFYKLLDASRTKHLFYIIQCSFS